MVQMKYLKYSLVIFGVIQALSVRELRSVIDLALCHNAVPGEVVSHDPRRHGQTVYRFAYLGRTTFGAESTSALEPGAKVRVLVPCAMAEKPTIRPLSQVMLDHVSGPLLVSLCLPGLFVLLGWASRAKAAWIDRLGGYGPKEVKDAGEKSEGSFRKSLS